MENQIVNRRRTIRNLIIFTIVAAGGGFLGILLDQLQPPEDPMQGLGALLWLTSPLVANVLLRSFGKDGWKDFGLGLNLRSGWPWYLLAIVITPVVVLPVFGLGSLFRVYEFAEGASLAALLPLVGVGFLAAMPKNIFEEFAWRGYLTPRFEALGLHPLINALLTGFIWAAWHVPYYLYYLDKTILAEHSTLAMPVFILLAFLVLPFQALFYGELRLISKSVWPVWILHNIANGVGLTLISAAFITLKPGFGGVLLSPGTEGILYALLLGAAGYGLYRYRTNKNR